MSFKPSMSDRVNFAKIKAMVDDVVTSDADL